MSKALNGGIDYSDEAAGEGGGVSGNASVGTVKVGEVYKNVRSSMKHYFRDLNLLKKLEVEQSISLATSNAAAARKDDERKAARQREVEQLNSEYEQNQKEKQGSVVAMTGDETDGDAKAKKKKKKKKKGGDEGVPEIVYRALPQQDPVLFLPAGLEPSVAALEYPICFRPTPPPAPDKPFAIKIGDTFVKLEWEQADFDGVVPSRYDIHMRNDTRLYSDWRLAPNASNIRSGGLYTRFIVNHLPIGIKTEFRIVGYNSVGQSHPSKASVKITPGENLQPVGSEHRWRRLAHGGSLAVLDHMEHYIHYRNEVLRGFRLLVAFAQKTQGFFRMSAQVRSCRVSLKALAQFPHDLTVICGSLLLIGYAFQGASQNADSRALAQVSELVTEHKLPVLINKYMTEFSGISHFRQGVYWCLAWGVPLPGVSFHQESTENGVPRASKEELFNIFRLQSEEGDEEISEEGKDELGQGGEREAGSSTAVIFSGTNPMRL